MGAVKYAVDYGIIGILISLSIVSIAIAIERWMTYRRIQIEKYTKKKELELKLVARLHIIATVGSNAPYLGLLGTVLGILFTFYTIGSQGGMEPAKMMVGLALALKATAVGLCVAIPSVVLYNYLLQKAKKILIEWDIVHG